MGRVALLFAFFLFAPQFARADEPDGSAPRALDASALEEGEAGPLEPDEQSRAEMSDPSGEREDLGISTKIARFFAAGDAPLADGPALQFAEDDPPEDLDGNTSAQEGRLMEGDGASPARSADLFAEDALLRAVASAAAPEIAAAETAALKPRDKRPLLVEDRFRYGNLWLIPRGVLSGVAIPLSIPTWSPHQITRMVATTATVTTMMLPFEPSLDVRLYRAMQSARTPFLDAILPKIYTIPMTIGIAAYTTILAAGFYFFKRPRLREYVSLMLEALGVVQFYHVSLKLLIGREGPYQSEGEGRVFGPTRVFFPGGTPSGHTASAFAILVTAAEYYGTWPIRILAYVGASYLATSFAYNNQHFASDVIWGAMMGDTVARWVVRHRSSVNRGPALRPKLQAAPMVVPGGAGFSLSLSGGGFL